MRLFSTAAWTVGTPRFISHSRRGLRASALVELPFDKLRTTRRAFTLIELLVVVAIIAILISILMPALNEARNAARTVVCQANIRQIGLGVQTYAAEHRGFILYDENLTTWQPNSHNYELPDTQGKLYPDHVSRPLIAANDEFDSPSELVACPSFTFAKHAWPDPGGVNHLMPYSGRGPHGEPMPTNVNHANQTNGHMFRTYRTNDFLAVIPSTHSANPTDDDKKLTRMSQVRAPTLFVGFESHKKSSCTGWRSMYFNPMHDNRGPAVRIDGSVVMYPLDDMTLAPAAQGLWNVNYVNRSDVVDAWGNYLHPAYTKGY